MSDVTPTRTAEPAGDFNDPPLSKIARICRGLIFLDLAFLLFVTLEQLKEFGGWPRFVALILRVALLGFLGYKVWRGSRAATFGLGAIFALLGGVVATQVFQHHAHASAGLFRLGDRIVSAATALGALGVFSLVNAIACCVLARELKRSASNPPPVSAVSPSS
jgi:hypothetical protein